LTRKVLKRGRNYFHCKNFSKSTVDFVGKTVENRKNFNFSAEDDSCYDGHPNKIKACLIFSQFCTLVKVSQSDQGCVTTFH